MRTRLTLPAQWSLTLLIGLALGLTFQPQAGFVINLTPTPLPTPLPTTSASTQPVAPPAPSATAAPTAFTTLPGGWMVRMVIQRKGTPQIVKAIHLGEARLTALPPGSAHLKLIDAADLVLYETSLEPIFLQGEPPIQVDQVTIIIVLPDFGTATRILLETPNGNATYELPGR